MYVTDHEPVDPKYITASEVEDQDFFNYQQSLDEYNSDTLNVFKPAQRKQLYPKGSLMQKILDPLGGSTTDEDGAVNYHVEDQELVNIENEEFLRRKYENYKKTAEVWDVDEEDDDSFKQALVQELEEGTTAFDINEFEAVLDKELSIFKKDEIYDYVKDLKDAYKNSLKMTREERIFNTLPDHVFWDIKKP